MSIIRPVIRMCAVGALRNSTIAEERVFDSDNTPLIAALTADAQPYVTVYTDEDNRTEVRGRDIYSSARQLSLVVEFGVAAMVETEVSGGVQLQIPPTDEGLEVAVDLLESQVLGSLFGDPHNPWAELLRRLILGITSVRSPRGGAAEKGVRWAARQLIIVCDVISDPPPGVLIHNGHPVRDFIELALQDSPMSRAALLIDNLINSVEKVPWRQAQAWLGLTESAAEAIGIARYGVPEDEPADLLVVSPVREDWEYPIPSPDDDEFD